MRLAPGLETSRQRLENNNKRVRKGRRAVKLYINIKILGIHCTADAFYHTTVYIPDTGKM